MMRDSTQEYFRSLNTNPDNSDRQTYTLQVRPQRRVSNPELDYMKMVAMIAGAVIAGILYDKSKNK